MAGEPSEVQLLARAFARQLEHLREFSGVHYVGAGPMPRAELEPTPVAVEAPADNPQPAARGQEWTPAVKLAYLRERNVGDCQRCPLAQTRTKIVFGVGDPEAALMFVGEAPGADEDRSGEPFVGAAGKRLDQWLRALGLARSQVYIANVIKCRPPNNRDPSAQEVHRCTPFLHAQIRAIRPRVLIGLGRFAGAALIGSGSEAKLYEMRAKVHEYLEPKSELRVPVVVTYHPSYVLRREREQARPERGGMIKSEDQEVLDDLRRALALVQHT